MKSLLGKHFLSLADFTPEDLRQVLDTAVRLKQEARLRRREPLLAGRVLGMIFEQSSTRTRVSCEVAMRHLGGHALFLSAQDLKLARGEPIADTARVLSSYCDVLAARMFSHASLEELARHSAVPVINLMTDHCHPCQALADLLTLQECKGSLRGLRVTYLGDGNNVCHSLLRACALVGAHVCSCNPPGYQPDPAVVEQAREFAARWGSEVSLSHHPAAAVEGADALYTDVWLSPGQAGTIEERREAFRDYQVNEGLLGRAAPDAVVMHCLPARRGEEITAEVMEGPHSVVFQQAENRLHAQKALLVHLVA